MNTNAEWSAGEVADLLGVSVPTVRRVAGRLGLTPARTEGGHRRFDEEQVARLVSQLGIVPRIPGLSRVETQVLAALAAHPLGFTSMRAVGRAAGVSTAAAAKSLTKLEHKGLAVATDVTISDAGRARRARRFRLRVGQQWARLAACVATTVPPQQHTEVRARSVPRRFWHLFWNAQPLRLDLERDATFIATRMLLSGDVAAQAWALSVLPPAALEAAARNRAADALVRATVANALSA
jgi:excisionase family DNA binding protein